MDMKTLSVILVILIGATLVFAYLEKDWIMSMLSSQQSNTTEQMNFDGMNTTFTIDGREVTLVDGLSEEPAAPDSATMDTVRYFGREAIGDVNADGQEDVIFFITDDAGGTGTFYYVVAALKTNNGYQTTNAFLVGDRIAPKFIDVPPGTGEIVVNYVKLKDGEPFSAVPTQDASVRLKVTADNQLVGV